jgi:chorismate mutase
MPTFSSADLAAWAAATLPPARRAPRLAAGRARALGLPTRGTTNANRLRRVDRWLVATQVARLRALAETAKLDPEFSEKFLRVIIDEVIRHHQVAASS